MKVKKKFNILKIEKIKDNFLSDFQIQQKPRAYILIWFIGWVDLILSIFYNNVLEVPDSVIRWKKILNVRFLDEMTVCVKKEISDKYLLNIARNHKLIFRNNFRNNVFWSCTF